MTDDLDEFLALVGTDVPVVSRCSACGGADVCAADCPNLAEYLRLWDKYFGFAAIYGGRVSYKGNLIVEEIEDPDGTGITQTIYRRIS